MEERKRMYDSYLNRNQIFHQNDMFFWLFIVFSIILAIMIIWGGIQTIRFEKKTKGLLKETEKTFKNLEDTENKKN